MFHFLYTNLFLLSIYLLKVDNGNNRTSRWKLFEVSFKDTKKTSIQFILVFYF